LPLIVAEVRKWSCSPPAELLEMVELVTLMAYE